jgi:hypothetical protein
LDAGNSLYPDSHKPLLCGVKIVQKRLLVLASGLLLAIAIAACASGGSQSLPNIVTNAAQTGASAPPNGVNITDGLTDIGGCDNAVHRGPHPLVTCDTPTPDPNPCDTNNNTICITNGGTDFTDGVGGGGGTCPPPVDIAHRDTLGRHTTVVHTDCNGSPGGGGSGSTLGQTIATAASNFYGPQNCGASLADSGNGCMWSVDQVLSAAGAGALGNGSYYVPTAINTAVASGQATLGSSYPPPAGTTFSAQAGDLVVWWGGDGQTTFAGCQADQACGEHIGVCLNNGCTSALANSTSASIATGECQFTDYGSATNPQYQSAAYGNAQIVHVNY